MASAEHCPLWVCFRSKVTVGSSRLAPWCVHAGLRREAELQHPAPAATSQSPPPPPPLPRDLRSARASGPSHRQLEPESRTASQGDKGASGPPLQTSPPTYILRHLH